MEGAAVKLDQRSVLTKLGNVKNPLSFILSGVLLAASHAAEPDAKVNLAAEGDLPQGRGIAAAFPEDMGITKHPEVIFADTFENGEFGQGWDETNNKDGKVLSFVDPELPLLGERCVKVTATLGHDTGGGFTKWFESAPTVFVRFYTKFDPTCDYTHHFVRLRANKSLQGKDKWSGFGQAGLKPDGSERFTTGVEPWGENGKLPPPGKWLFYSYWHEMEKSGDGKYWGNHFDVPEAPPIEKGRWICVEIMLRHNTPGKPDGEQAFWIDGKPVGHWKGINWRTSPTLWANSLTLESYVTDRWTKNPINTVFFDSLVIAKSYIGPATQ